MSQDLKSGEATELQPGEGVRLYVRTALMAEDAWHKGHWDFARALEQSLETLLESLPRAKQWEALRLSFQISMGEDRDLRRRAAPHLRLVHSRNG
jgi:hypothetical protein